MIVNPNIQAALKDAAENGVFHLVNAGAPTSGTTGAGLAGKGCILSDITNGVLYINTGTLASPTWTKVGTQS